MAPADKGKDKASSGPKKESKGKKTYSLYEVKGDKVHLKTKLCPKCGSYLGKHKDRFACGKCAYTEKI